MKNKRYYPSPMLDTALYYLQNHRDLAGVNAKKLVDMVEVDGMPIGRGAWSEAKRLLATHSEPRHRIHVDMNTMFITYVGAKSRLVCLSKSRESLAAKLTIWQADEGYRHVFTSLDKKFHVYELKANESEAAA